MPRAKNFMERSARPLTATDQDFTALLAAHLAPNAIYPQEIELQRIRPNPFQARRSFDVTDLVAAIKAHGFTSRLRVRQDPADPRYFQLVFGERRLRAAELAGLATVPCDVGVYSDEDLIEIGLAENIQRHELKPLEEARAFQTMIDERGYSVRRLAQRIGMDKGYVENRLALLRTPPDVQEMVEQRPDTISAAREIAKITDPRVRGRLITQVVAGTLTKEKVRQRVRSGLHGPVSDPPALARELTQAVDRDIDTMRSILARWRQSVAHLDGVGREHMLSYIDEHLRELEQLTEALRP
jgi:ParB family transcriptional regulator, chromosome partitioning protein